MHQVQAHGNNVKMVMLRISIILAAIKTQGNPYRTGGQMVYRVSTHNPNQTEVCSDVVLLVLHILGNE
jgi:hypothetical protein